MPFQMGDPRTTPQLYSPSEAFNTRRPPLGFATSPAGAQGMDALRAKLQQSVQRAKQEQDFRQRINSPTANPWGDQPPLGDAAAVVAGMLGQMGAGQAGLPDLPSNDESPVQAAMMDRHNQVMADGGMAGPGAMFGGGMDNAALGGFNGPYQSFNNTPAGNPPVGAPSSAGLMPELAAKAELYNQQTRRGSEGGRLDEVARLNPMRSGYNPAPIGTASPGRRAEMLQQNQLGDPATIESIKSQLRNIVPSLQVVANGGPGNDQFQAPVGVSLRDAPGFADQVAAERLRDSLPADQRAGVGVPTSVRGNYPTAITDQGIAGTGSLPRDMQQKIAYFNSRNADPKYQSLLADRQQLAIKSQLRRDSRAQDIRDIQSGIHPSFVAAQNMLARSGGDGGGAGGINPAQLNMMMAMHPEAAAALAQGAMQMPAQMMAAQAQMGQLALQQQVVNNQQQQQKQQADAAFAPGHAGNVARIRAAGGFHKVTPEQQRQSVLDAIGAHGNAFGSAQARKKLLELGADPVDAYVALNGMVPDPEIGLARKGAEFLKGNNAAANEQAWRDHLAAEAAKRTNKRPNR